MDAAQASRSLAILRNIRDTMPTAWDDLMREPAGIEIMGLWDRCRAVLREENGNTSPLDLTKSELRLVIRGLSVFTLTAGNSEHDVDTAKSAMRKAQVILDGMAD